MKKLAIALCVISTQAFGMELKPLQHKSAFRVVNVPKLHRHLVDSLRKDNLSPQQRAFARDMIKDLEKIQKEKALECARTFQSSMKRRDAFFKKLAQEAVECIEKAVAAKKARKK
jgi:uncharacterized protein YwqG